VAEGVLYTGNHAGEFYTLNASSGALLCQLSIDITPEIFEYHNGLMFTSSSFNPPTIAFNPSSCPTYDQTWTQSVGFFRATFANGNIFG